MLQHPHPRQTQVTVGPYLQEFFLDPRMSCIYVLHLLGHFFVAALNIKYISNQLACIYRVNAPISEINTIPHMFKWWRKKQIIK